MKLRNHEFQILGIRIYSISIKYIFLSILQFFLPRGNIASHLQHHVGFHSISFSVSHLHSRSYFRVALSSWMIGCDIVGLDVLLISFQNCDIIWLEVFPIQSKQSIQDSYCHKSSIKSRIFMSDQSNLQYNWECTCAAKLHFRISLAFPSL